MVVLLKRDIVLLERDSGEREDKSGERQEQVLFCCIAVSGVGVFCG